jgi:hypothetical protein
MSISGNYGLIVSNHKNSERMASAFSTSKTGSQDTMVVKSIRES